MNASGAADVRAPNTLLLVFLVAAATAAATWILPGGRYDRATVEGREVVVPGTFTRIDREPQGPGDLLMAPLQGFVAAGEIIAFVLLVGGAFSVVQATGAIDRGIRVLAAAHRASRAVRVGWIPLFMVLFSLAGAVFGMSEEVIPFALVFVPLALTLGYDSIVGVAVPYVGAHAGFAAAFLNPFTIGVAQGIAEVPLFSGLGYRLVCWAVVTAVAVAWVGVYAHRVHRRPELSPMHELDALRRRRSVPTDESAEARLTGRHWAVLLLFAAAMGLLVFGVLRFGWYIPEIAALFVGLAMVAAAVGGVGAAAAAGAFSAGAAQLVGTALVIASARAILVLAEQGRIIDTILHGLAEAVGGLHPVMAGQAMFLAQAGLNFFVPSGSGQAALTMPILAPLSDLVGLSRQTAVLAFQFGDGFTNMIIPTSAVLMGVLALGEIPWERWLRWILPLELVFVGVAMLLLVPPILWGWP